MNYKQKELVLLPYPFTDQEGSKMRPAIVISNDQFNSKSSDRVMVPITSVIKDQPYSILMDPKDLVSGKLEKISRIKLDKVFSIDQHKVIISFGKVNDNLFNKITSEIKKIF